MTLKIIFPPQFEPFQPYLSLPYIKGLLKIYDIDATCFDANVDFYWWLFKKAQDANMPSSRRKQYLFSNVTKSVEIIRDIPQNLWEYRLAINVADEYLKTVSPPGVQISLTSLTIGNKYSSDDLQEYLQSKDNIFRDYFAYAEEDILGPMNVKFYMFSLVVLDQLGAALTFAQEIKSRRPAAKIIVGGPLISQLYKRLFNLPWIHEIFDIIAPGEAYKVLPSILGLKHRWDGHLTPDFSDLNLGQYFSCSLVLPYIASHGCNWGRCAFCSHHLSYKDYRESKIRCVVNDFVMLSRKYGVKYISFSDEYLTPKQLEQLADLTTEADLDIRWSSFARAEPRFADMDFTKRLYDAGCRMLMFGFESASQKVLNSMRKGTQVKYYASILESCKNANMAVRLDFMIGFPGETEDNMQQTFSFIKKNHVIIDTPFSSYATAVFELREGIPVMNDLEKYGIKAVTFLRGELDEQYQFLEEKGTSFHQKREWRHKMIGYAKNELNAELITPQNKTHQLILKDLYDRDVFSLPVTKIEPDQLRNLWGRWSPGVVINKNGSYVRITNYATGGELQIVGQLTNVIEVLEQGTDLASVPVPNNILSLSTFAKLINFLYRNDYIVIDNKKQLQEFKPMDRETYVRMGIE